MGWMSSHRWVSLIIITMAKGKLRWCVISEHILPFVWLSSQKASRTVGDSCSVRCSLVPLSLWLISMRVYVLNESIFLLGSRSPVLLLLLFCRQSDADDDSEMRTQVHWARVAALLGASIAVAPPDAPSRPDPRHPSLFPITHFLVCFLCFCVNALARPATTSLTAHSRLISLHHLNTLLNLISQVPLRVNGVYLSLYGSSKNLIFNSIKSCYLCHHVIYSPYFPWARV